MELTELADKIEALVSRKYPRLKLTDEDIAEMLFADAFYRPRINQACHWLCGAKRLTRDGDGVAHSPYWYRPWTQPIERRGF